MNYLIAIGHIIGAIIVTSFIATIVNLITKYKEAKSTQTEIEDVAVQLGVPVSDLDNKEIQATSIKIIYERYSTNHFTNRLSDFFETVTNGLKLISVIIQIFFFVSIIWKTFTGNPDIAAYIWLLIPLYLLLVLTRVLFSSLCHLITGRYPGQSKRIRAYISQNSGAI